MSDVGAVAWKEFREQYLRKGKPSRGLVVGLLFTLVVGVIGPIVVAVSVHNAGAPFDVVLPLLIPIMMWVLGMQGFGVTMAFAIDTFMGERERHTLETLLASPLSTRSIVLGKFATVLGTVLVQIVLATCLEFTVYLVAFGSAALGYWPVLVCAPLLALAVATMVACTGVIVSTKAMTLKAGQQAMAYIFMPLYMLGGFFGALARTDFGRWAGSLYDQLGPFLFFLLFAAAWLALDTLLFSIALRVYRRDRILQLGRKAPKA
jgi:ABC-2 type transport system permease protein